MSGSTPLTTIRIGRGIGLVGHETLAVFEPANGLLAEDLWILVEAGAGIDDLLEAVSTTGLRALGSFAIAQFEDAGIRVVVRGSAVVDIGSASAVKRVLAEGVRTWVEDFATGATQVTLRLGGVSSSPQPFRIDRGLVPADLLARGVSLARPQLAKVDLAWIDEFTPPVVQAARIDMAVVPQPEPIAPEEHTILVRDLPVDEAPEPEAVSDFDYDALYGHTVARCASNGSPAPARGIGSDGDRGAVADRVDTRFGTRFGTSFGTLASPVAELGDHDGHTMSKAQLAALRGAQPATGVSAGPTVQAVFCASRHPNPAQSIRRCRRECQRARGLSIW